MLCLSSSLKKAKEKIKELEGALATAGWRAEALLKDLKKVERRASEHFHRLTHLEYENRHLRNKYNQMVREHNEMVDQFVAGTNGNPFTPEELKILIGLCHPDKHGGKESANKMTQKLLAMRQ